MELLHGLARLQLTPRRCVLYAPTPFNLSPKVLGGAALGMALASAYAISGLSQGELCSTIYGLSRFIELPIAALPLSEALPPDHFLHRWSWCDIDSGAPLLIPLESRILDHQRLAAQTHRDTDRETRLLPPRWQDVTLRFASKVLNMAGISPGARGHYERLLHERHWTVGHNSCKGAKTESDRKLLLRCPLFVRRMPPPRSTHMITSSGPTNTPC